jgi:molybdate transport system regulatory protein
MMISARNQIDATVEAVRKGAVNAVVDLKTAQGTMMVASITNSAAEALQLKEGDRVVAFFKASHVLIATGWAIAISARNKLEGMVESVRSGTVNAEITVKLPGGDRVIATITDEAARNLALREGENVAAVIKATDVMIAKLS